MTGRPHIVDANLIAWQAERKAVNSDLRYYLLGIVSTKPNTEAVSQQGNGGTRFFCTTHQMVYAVKEECPGCLAKPVEDPIAADDDGGRRPSAEVAMPAAIAATSDAGSGEQGAHANV